MATNLENLDALTSAVVLAIREYDATGDHHHGGGPVPGDCIRCALVAALPEWVRGCGLRVEGRSSARPVSLAAARARQVR